MEILKLFVPDVKLLHQGLSDQQSFLQLLCIETVKIINAKALIRLREEGLASLTGERRGPHETI